jgi:hypothetical protein
LATLVSLSPRKLEYLREAGDIPSVRVGRSVRYSPDAVLAALVKKGGSPAEPKRRMVRVNSNLEAN